MHRRAFLGLSLVALASVRDASALADAAAATDATDATRVVLFRDANHTSLTVQTRHQGGAAPFSMRIPAPPDAVRATMRLASGSVLDHLDLLTAPRLVDAWEIDPCSRRLFEGIGLGSLGGEGISHSMSLGDRGVKVEAKFPDGRVDGSGIGAIDAGQDTIVEAPATSTALRIDYDSPTLSVPIHFAPIDGDRAEDLVVFVIAPKRYEAASIPNAVAPTNVELSPDAWGHFDATYDALFDKTRADHADHGAAAVTEFSGSFAHCDPCAPFEPGRDVGGGLRAEELATLGGDVAPSFEGRLLQSPVGRVRETAVQLHGPLEQRELSRIVQQNHGRFRACYQTALRIDPTIKGLMSVGFTVTRDGHVINSTVVDSTSNAALDACLARQPTALDFPKRPAPTTVVYGLALESEPSTELVHEAASWVVTRLHLRITNASPNGELVLRPAAGIAGGHGAEGDGGALDPTVTPGDFDSFQSRYVIHHPWSGTPTCADPRRGHWGGRSFLGEEQDAPGVEVADLAAFRRPRVPLTASAGDGGSDDVGASDASADGAIEAPAAPKPRGCGACAVGRPGDGTAMGALGVGLVLLGGGHRRRRARDVTRRLATDDAR